MASYDFATVNVFTDRRFGGNPLAVLPDANGLTDQQMQAIAAEFNLSETVFDKIGTLVPSGRNELEITDVNNAYINEGVMSFDFLNGWWTDAGTFESLHRAANLVYNTDAKHTAASWENEGDSE